jgi:hypothetical protein
MCAASLAATLRKTCQLTKLLNSNAKISIEEVFAGKAAILAGHVKSLLTVGRQILPVTKSTGT